MRPDRIIVGEVRGEEVLDMLQAMNTGHDGSLTTIHANSSRDALIRVETMVALTGADIPSKFLRHYISSALDIVIHVSRLADGSRKLMSLQEITGIEGEVIALQEIFTFEQTGGKIFRPLRSYHKDLCAGESSLCDHGRRAGISAGAMGPCLSGHRGLGIFVPERKNQLCSIMT